MLHNKYMLQHQNLVWIEMYESTSLLDLNPLMQSKKCLSQKPASLGIVLVSGF